MDFLNCKGDVDMAEKKALEGQTAVVNAPLITGKSPETVVPSEQEEKPVQATDKTVPGGRYVVNGQLVNSDGKPVKE
jgi:hypothetical protein